MRTSIITLALLGLISSCHKSDRDFDQSVKASEDANLANIFVKDVFFHMDEAFRIELGQLGSEEMGLISCATRSSTLNSNPVTLNLNFGDSCAGSDGRYRGGQLYFELSNGAFKDSGSIITANFIDFSYMNLAVSGEISFVWGGTGNDGKQAIKVSSTSLKFVQESPAWNSDLAFTFNMTELDGENTPNITDDSYTVSESFDSRSRSGNSFTVDTQVNLVWDATCPYISTGQVWVRPDNLTPRDVTFGTGECDSIVDLFFNGTEHIIVSP